MDCFGQLLGSQERRGQGGASRLGSRRYSLVLSSGLKPAVVGDRTHLASGEASRDADTQLHRNQSDEAIGRTSIDTKGENP